MELQQFHDYGHQDQETIQYLEKHLAVERQLGYAEGMAQAARDQFCTTSWGCSPVQYHSNNEYARELQRAADKSQRSYWEEECHSDQTSGAGPSYSRPPSLSHHDHHGPTHPTTTTQRAQQPELPGPSHPTPAETITIKVKTNMWPEPLSIKPSRLACLPLLSEAVATGMKTMVVRVANAPKKPKDVADYHQRLASSMGLQSQRRLPTSSTYSAEQPIFNTITAWPWAMRSTAASLRQTKDIYNVVLSLQSLLTLRCCDDNRPTSSKSTCRRSNESPTSQ